MTTAKPPLTYTWFSQTRSPLSSSNSLPPVLSPSAIYFLTQPPPSSFLERRWWLEMSSSARGTVINYKQNNVRVLCPSQSFCSCGSGTRRTPGTSRGLPARRSAPGRSACPAARRGWAGGSTGRQRRVRRGISTPSLSTNEHLHRRDAASARESETRFDVVLFRKTVPSSAGSQSASPPLPACYPRAPPPSWRPPRWTTV